jgi:hypothetical protein
LSVVVVILGKPGVKIVLGDAEDGASARAGQMVNGETFAVQPAVNGSDANSGEFGDGVDAEQVAAVPLIGLVAGGRVCLSQENHQVRR